MATLMITNDQLIRSTPLGGNIDVDDYRMIIEECQTFVIEPILGTKLYRKITADFDEGLEGHYSTIHGTYIVPILAYTVAAEFISISSYNVRNGGTFKFLPEHSQPLEMKEISHLSQNQRAKADVYIERLIDFLRDKKSEIPEYTSNQEEDYDIKPDRDLRFYGGWNLSNDHWNFGNDAERHIWKDIWHDEGA